MTNRKTHQNITTVSLLDTWEIKQNMQREGGNFSRFVRNCLREWARYEQEIECFRETNEARILKCFPRDSRLCLKCWPDGPPSRHDWNEYSGFDLQAWMTKRNAAFQVDLKITNGLKLELRHTTPARGRYLDGSRSALEGSSSKGSQSKTRFLGEIQGFTFRSLIDFRIWILQTCESALRLELQ